MMQRKTYWIGGTVTAFLGVALVKLLAPELGGTAASIVLTAGYALVALGLGIIAAATRRKAPEALMAARKDARD